MTTASSASWWKTLAWHAGSRRMVSPSPMTVSDDLKKASISGMGAVSLSR